MPTFQRVNESTLYPGLFIEYIEGGIEGAQALWLGAKQRITLCPYGGGMPTLQRVSESTLYPGLFIVYRGGYRGCTSTLVGSQTEDYVPMEVACQHSRE